MNSEIEELVNDPGNHAVLKHLASNGELDFKKLRQETGINGKRLREKLDLLEEKGFIEVQRDSYPVNTALREKNREKLRETRDSIEEFIVQRKDLLREKNSKEFKRLEDLREDLEKEKEEVKLPSSRKKIEARLESVKNSMKMIQDSDEALEEFRAYSHAHRTLRKHGSRNEEFGSFNPFRRLKAVYKIDEILKHEPEEKETRKFFGSRWITQDKLDRTG